MDINTIKPQNRGLTDMANSTGDDLLAKLRSNWLFSSGTIEESEAVLRFTGVRQLKANQTLFWQEDPVGHLFLVFHGSLKMIRRDKKDRHRVTRIAGATDLVALHCLFTEHGYGATAVAIGDCDVLAINAERFLWHVKQNTEWGWRIALCLSREVEEMVQEIGRVTMYTASERLAAYLLEIHENQEAMNGRGVPRRRADLASLLSLSTETLCREISKFRHSGWIATHQERFTVLEPERLRSLVDTTVAN